MKKSTTTTSTKKATKSTRVLPATSVIATVHIDKDVEIRSDRITSKALEQKIIEGKEKLNPVLPLVTVRAPKAKYTCSTKNPMNQCLMYALVCIGNKSHDQAAGEMGMSYSQLSSWLQKIRKAPLSVPINIYKQFENISCRRYRCTVEDLAAMTGYCFKTQDQLLEEAKERARERAKLRRQAKARDKAADMAYAAKVTKAARVINIADNSWVDKD